MKIFSIYIISFLFILSCSTVDNSLTTKDIPAIHDEITTTEVSSELPTDLISEETIHNYDLTVLKGKSYPIIKNDTPFTEVEIDILNKSDGLELVASVEVAHYFKYFLRDKRDLLNLWIKNARPYIPLIRDLVLKEGLPEELIYLPFLESGYNTNAYSRVGAGGIWQFMPRTASSYGLSINWWVDERRSPELATPYAIKHLAYLNNLFNDWYTALAAYNAGEGRISRAMEKTGEYNYFKLIQTEVLAKETRRYVHQYLAIVKIMKNLDKLDFEPIDMEINENKTIIKVPGGTDLYELAEGISLKWDTFKKLNPAFRRKVTDPSKNSTIVIPINKKDETLTYIKNSKPITNSGYTYYSVRSGDSWWYLSQITNNSITSLKRLNNISTNNLKIGQRLLLPSSKIVVNVNNINTNTSSNYVNSHTNLKTYKVRSGDTISSISINYNIKLNSLFVENDLNSRSVLYVGQIIRLPGYPGTTTVTNNNIKTDVYTVKDGDSVWLIAQKTKIPYQELLTLNKLGSNSKLQVGDKIRLY